MSTGRTAYDSLGGKVIGAKVGDWQIGAGGLRRLVSREKVMQ